jgi:Mycothiol maleylpyruvate isomerase N-terminal domain
MFTGLALHLLGGSFSVISWLRDGFRGTLAPNDSDEQGFIDWLDALQATWVTAARRLSPRLLIELLEWSAKGFAEAIYAQDPSAIAAYVSWASADPVPVWVDHARELTEKWIHRQQILQALDQPSDLRPDLAGPVLEALRWAYPYRLGEHKRKAGAFVQIDIADEQLGQQWRIVSNGESWEFDGANPTIKLASMSFSGEQAWRLLTNNYDATTHGDLATTGDPELITTLLLTRAIIGKPK